MRPAVFIFSLVTLTAQASGRLLTNVLQLDGGPVRGIEKADMRAYLGIPYAAPPVGELRWMPPQTHEHWRSILNATQFGGRCAQNADLGVFATAGGGEDCLYLNVYVPKAVDPSKEKLPVLLWIHGGALHVGTSGDYNPQKLVVDGKAVVVTINYRLGVFGYFAHPTIDREGHEFANYGSMDQIFALEWVQSNIAAFAGDPGNVTIFGESSGGNSVLSLMASPEAAGKFQHAISMSGATILLKFPAAGTIAPLDIAEKRGAGFAEAAGCPGEEAATCLRKLTTQQILTLQAPYMLSQPVVDGMLLPITPAEAFQSGHFNHTSLMNGNTLDEGAFFVGTRENKSGVALSAVDYAKGVRDYYHGALAERVLQQYPPERYNTPSDAMAAAVTASQFACPARALDRWLAGKISVYAYEFADRTAPSYLQPTTFAMGALHTGELPYIFLGFHGGAGTPVSLNPLQEKLAEEMVKYWSHAGLAGAWEAQWPSYDPAQDNFLSLLLPAARMTSHVFSDTHDCAFWDQTGLY